jgi:hypothetical protein
MHEIVNVGSRLELFIDRLLVDSMDGVDFALHSPQLAPPARAPICGDYMTVLMDNGCYRGYFRQYDQAYIPLTVFAKIVTSGQGSVQWLAGVHSLPRSLHAQSMGIIVQNEMPRGGRFRRLFRGRSLMCR